MQRRGGSGQPVKGQSANRPKARNAPTPLPIPPNPNIPRFSHPILISGCQSRYDCKNINENKCNLLNGERLAVRYR